MNNNFQCSLPIFIHLATSLASMSFHSEPRNSDFIQIHNILRLKANITTKNHNIKTLEHICVILYAVCLFCYVFYIFRSGARLQLPIVEFCVSFFFAGLPLKTSFVLVYAMLDIKKFPKHITRHLAQVLLRLTLMIITLGIDSIITVTNDHMRARQEMRYVIHNFTEIA